LIESFSMPPSVAVEPTAVPNVILMTWQPQVAEEDVQTAFSSISYYLAQTLDPLYVVVDLLAKPSFPMATTISEALRGPFAHPQMAGWVIVGGNRAANIIEKVLSNITRRKNVYWMESHAEAKAFLRARGIEME
jgi:hypothetical protein